MTIREIIHAEVDRLPDEELEKLLPVVEGMRDMNGANGAAPNEHILQKLMRIRINAPADFSENFEQYASGEKTFGDVR